MTNVANLPVPNLCESICLVKLDSPVKVRPIQGY
jgi:hypothetical protein